MRRVKTRNPGRGNIGIAAATLICLSLSILISCRKDNSVNTDTQDNSYTTDANNNGIPDIYEKIYGATNMYVSGDYIIIQSQGLPDHTSPYYAGTPWEDSLYAPYDGDNASFYLAPGVISAMNYTFKIPLNPQEAAAKQATPLGPIGISLNGVPFFNQYNGAGASLGDPELNTFDQWNGHPTPMNSYHYHKEPLYLTQTKGSDALLGFLLDGFPVYGPVENGVTITDADLDAYHGHFGPTADYPNGIYHYHVTSEDPYINGDGFYGTPGTVSF